MGAEQPRRLLGPDGEPVARAPAAAPKRPRASLGVGAYPNAYSYDAADVSSQDMAAWLPWLRSPDAEINLFRDRVVSRARDLVRNDGWASGGIDRILDNAVGAQFRMVAKPNLRALERACPALDKTWAAEFSSAVESEWRLWSEDPNRRCDGTRRQDVTQMFRLALAHKLIDGDAFCVLLWAPDQADAGGPSYATTMQMIDPDRVSNPFDAVDTRHLRGGVELDDVGAPIAYHIRRAHQDDWYLAAESMIWDRVERETPWGRPIVVHDFDRERAGQNRGMTVLAPVMSRFKMLTRYDGAELQAAILQTIMSFFIESPYDEEDMRGALEAFEGDRPADRLKYYGGLREEFHQKNAVTAGGVRIPKLFPGEKIGTVSATRPATSFEAFEHTVLRHIASQLGISAEQLSNDYSKTNYSSARAAMVEVYKTLMRRRVDFAKGFATPIYAAWLEEAIEGRLADLMPAGAPPFAEWRAAYAGCRWIGPGRGWVDPKKEREGAVLGLDAGFSTLEQECAEQGMDWEENLDQRAREVARMKELGLKLPVWADDEQAAKSERAA